MNPGLLLPSYITPQAALLPAPGLLPWVNHGLWALVLASLCLGLSRRWPPRLRGSLAALVAVATWLPGSLSPAYWLGLAFQAPSLMGAALCLVWASRSWRRGAAENLLHHRAWPYRLALPDPWSVAGLLLGWLLLLDLLAVLPLGLYGLGFGTPALAASLGACALLWVLTQRRPGSAGAAALLFAVLSLYVLTRWPTGNLWDALIDPWLWLALHLRLFRPSRP